MKIILKNIIIFIETIITLFLSIATILMIYGYITKDITPFGKYGISTVISGSMEPTIMTNSFVLFKEISNNESLNIGDIIIFTNPDFKKGKTTLFCHRIINIDDTMYITKGDANIINDPYPTHILNIKGKVVCIWNGIGPISASNILLTIIILSPISIIYILFIKNTLLFQKERPKNGRSGKNRE